MTIISKSFAMCLGPGASSLYGLLVELGPFILNDLSRKGPLYEETKIPQLIYNQYGWQKSASIVALSIPPPIGNANIMQLYYHRYDLRSVSFD
jgi:carboxypeptidase C (cathepsin A)